MEREETPDDECRYCLGCEEMNVIPHNGGPGDVESVPCVCVREEVDAERRAQVRALDVALNGEEGAAPHASLCGLVAQAPKIRAELLRLRRVAWGVTHNAHRIHLGGNTIAGMVAERCGLGSTAAAALCREHGVDPDAEVPRVQTGGDDDVE